MTQRILWTINGTDRLDFLQNLVTNDVMVLRQDGIIWTGLLTPQGKYLADFFVLRRGDDLLIDIAEPLAESTLRRLSMYRLRADVQIVPSDLKVARGLGPMPDGAFADPRHSGMGWRLYDTDAIEAPEDWDALRVRHTIPESGIELTPDTFILEAGFERLNGVDFRKGCYVGQEVTARMKHKTELKKGLRRVAISKPVPVGTEITANEKPAGTIFTTAGNEAIAYLRFDRINSGMMANNATVSIID
ncbi:folate-binding protein YgfZ [Falsirhodobacter sp. alg1]|uniref:CAF17-like 4Fe-4S cluster assembly/insertion protein YgfZ n=1 Tax=Falsirhodobacter sp. alg1 TaxID=1472418 RepID=UPI0005ED979E|nr:folate-binding protein YgfZ [Falsirhodobacter sp. alg1]